MYNCIMEHTKITQQSVRTEEYSIERVLLQYKVVSLRNYMGREGTKKYQWTISIR